MTKASTKTQANEFGGRKLRALGDRVVIRQDTAEKRSKGGIIIPDYVQEKPREGVVVAVGTGKRVPRIVDGKVLDGMVTVPLDVKVDDRVLFGKYCGTAVKQDDAELLVVREDDILGVIED